jgi:hypothetical protein
MTMMWQSFGPDHTLLYIQEQTQIPAMQYFSTNFQASHFPGPHAKSMPNMPFPKSKACLIFLPDAEVGSKSHTIPEELVSPG